MKFKLLAIGDVVGNAGLQYLIKKLPALKQETLADFVVVNGENSNIFGILPEQAQSIWNAGADVITLGNHTWNSPEIKETLHTNDKILRPANDLQYNIGKGTHVYIGPNQLKIAILNLIGRTDMNGTFENPFHIADTILNHTDCDIIAVDFHAASTGEKAALAHNLDGRVQIFWGTHTHVPTADCQILPKGLGFVTDLGMTGAYNSVLGMRVEEALLYYKDKIPQKFQVAEGPCTLNAVLFTIDTETKLCIDITRKDLYE